MKTILLLLTFTLGAFAQNCVHTNLSKDFDFAVYTKWYGSEQHTLSDSLNVTVEIIHKITKARQEIHFGSGWMFDDAYTRCSHVRSYSTGVNKDSIVSDNDFGDIVVADVNFDGRDDVAFKQNAGGKGGAPYYFYIQDKQGHFTLNTFLTENMVFFPDEFVPSKKQLITRVHANVYEYSETYYEYLAPPTGDGWRQHKTERKAYDTKEE